MSTKQHIIVTPHKGIADYIRIFHLTKGRIEEENLEVEWIKRIDETRVEEQLSGKFVYCLSKVQWLHHAELLIDVEVDTEALGKPLSKATGHDIAITMPKKSYYRVNKLTVEETELGAWEKFKRTVFPGRQTSGQVIPKQVKSNNKRHAQTKAMVSN